MPFRASELYEEYEKDRFQTSTQKKAAEVLSHSRKAERKDDAPEFRELQDRERERLEAFFGYAVDVPSLPQGVTPEAYQEWQERGYDLHYLPNEDLTEERDLPGWQKKPGKRYSPGKQWGIEFFDEVKNGNLPKDATRLPGAWVLADTRQKPAYKNGTQLYPDDELMGRVLEKLRKAKALPDFNTKTSRFNLSWEELHSPQVKAAIGEALNVPPESLRLPRAIEWNFLGNAHHQDWGDTNTWEWFEDTYQSSKRLSGGHSENGGLSYVGWFEPRVRNDILGFRPLVVFS